MDNPISKQLVSNETAFGSPIRTDAPAPPESVNEGGTFLVTDLSQPETVLSDPRLVIRGENPTIENPYAPLNPQAAIIDWLSFTFLMPIEGSEFIALDSKLRVAFGFGIGACRHRKHLNYDESWELGNSFGIFASGGSSVGGTSYVSVTGEGCMATKNWQAVHDLIVELRATITRIDLAHDDFLGEYGITEAKAFHVAGGFNGSHGRPPKPKLLDDFDTGDGKTFYVGQRKNGKLLRVYEKGKQLGDPNSPWVRWELELHNAAYVIHPITILNPGLYLAGAYPCLNWISKETRHFEAVKQAQTISFEKLKTSCRNSYGKLLWTMRHVLNYSDRQIVDQLEKEGVPSRMNMPVVEGGDAL